MFVELSRKEYDELKPFLIAKKVRYEPSDCTCKGDITQYIHIEFSDLSPELVQAINKKIDQIVEKVSIGVDLENSFVSPEKDELGSDSEKLKTDDLFINNLKEDYQ